jgi:hypothetical protein
VRLFRERLLEADNVLSLSARPKLGEATTDSPPAPVPASALSDRPVRLDQVRVQYPGVNDRPYLFSGQALAVQVGFDALEPTEGVVFTIEVRNVIDDPLIKTDTDILGQHIDLDRGPGWVEFLFDSFPFLDGVYRVVVGIQSRLGGMVYDWREPACSFEVMNPGKATGLVSLPVAVRVLHGGHQRDLADTAEPAPETTATAAVEPAGVATREGPS